MFLLKIFVGHLNNRTRIYRMELVEECYFWYFVVILFGVISVAKWNTGVVVNWYGFCGIVWYADLLFRATMQGDMWKCKLGETIVKLMKESEMHITEICYYSEVVTYKITDWRILMHRVGSYFQFFKFIHDSRNFLLSTF